jgi:predicted peptidase
MKLHLLLLFTLSFSSLLAQQTGHQMALTHTDSLQYLLYTPPAYTPEGDTLLPLLLFLHGGGEGGTDLEKVKTHGPPMMVDTGMVFPFFVLSPQNPREKGLWDEHAVARLLDSIMAEYPVDPARVYLTGLSRGGYGAWRMAMQYPGKFAALVPICGVVPGGVYASWVPDIPIWVFHGDQDDVIPVNESIGAIARLQQLGRTNVKFSIYPGVGHNSWEKAYAEPKLIPWLLKQRREGE